jgi:quinol monooxygenase YgiN
MIIISIELDIPPERIKEFLEPLVVICERMSLENGCISSGLFMDGSDENRYRLIGKWNKEEVLENYMQSEEFNLLLTVLSFLKKQPRMRLDVLPHITKRETLRKAFDGHMTNNIQM